MEGAQSVNKPPNKWTHPLEEILPDTKNAEIQQKSIRYPQSSIKLFRSHLKIWITELVLNRVKAKGWWDDGGERVTIQDKPYMAFSDDKK